MALALNLLSEWINIMVRVSIRQCIVYGKAGTVSVRVRSKG